jgi:hypothetical protein
MSSRLTRHAAAAASRTRRLRHRSPSLLRRAGRARHGAPRRGGIARHGPPCWRRISRDGPARRTPVRRSRRSIDLHPANVPLPTSRRLERRHSHPHSSLTTPPNPSSSSTTNPSPPQFKSLNSVTLTSPIPPPPQSSRVQTRGVAIPDSADGDLMAPKSAGPGHR